MPEVDVLNRPSWDDWFLAIAFVVSRRSSDAQTQHGAVIVDRHKHIVGVGFNGFPSGMDDATLPTNRPDKHPWMEHSETNALANCTVPLRDAGAVIYITGKPCFACMKALCRHGVTSVVHADRRGMSHETPEDLANFARLVREKGVDIRRVRPDLGRVFGDAFFAEMREHGFLGAPPDAG